MLRSNDEIHCDSVYIKLSTDFIMSSARSSMSVLVGFEDTEDDWSVIMSTDLSSGGDELLMS